MKRITFPIAIMLVLATVLGGFVQPLPQAAAMAQPATASSLSEVEIESLLLMREEEKLARDVYDVLYKEYGAQIFLNIYASESTHFDQMGVLLERYGINDPALAPGEFTDHHIQELYDMLVPMGLESLTGAYTVGAIIEEVDILDFMNFLDDADLDNKDIRQVYTSLMNASENHLRGFVSCLLTEGVVYEPSYLSAEQYAAILAEDTAGAGQTRGH